MMKLKSFFCVVLAVLFLCAGMSACVESPVEDPVTPPASDGTNESVPPVSDEESLEDPEPQPPVIVESRASFFATGDNLIHTGIWRQANRNTGGSGNDCRMDSDYDFKPFYASLEPMISSADIAFLNQETLVAADESGAPSNYPAFNTPRACGDAMVELGFNVVNVANNHMLDKQAQGLYNSVNYWRTKDGVTQVGAYLDESDFNDIRIVEKNGVRVAFLAYAEDPNNSGLGTKVSISNYQPYSSLGLYVPAMNRDILEKQVAAAKEKADFVVVAMHWGIENTTSLSSVQKEYAQLCANLGVDLVLGSHPHVVQTMEWMQSADGSGKTLVVYSLGNMISLMEFSEANMLGGALTLDFVKKGEECSLQNVVFTPTVSHCSRSYREIGVYLLEEYTAEQYATHYIHSHCSTTIADFSRIMVEQIPEEFWGDKDYRS